MAGAGSGAELWHAERPAGHARQTDGEHALYTSAPSCDPANNCATGSLLLSIDKTDPTVTCGSTPTFVVSEPGAVVSASVADGVSGPGAATVSASVSTVSAGSFSVQLSGEDNAGRATTVSCAYRVSYRFEGFFAPIDNLPMVNKATAGQTIPVKWRISDYNGVGVSDRPASSASPREAEKPGPPFRRVSARPGGAAQTAAGPLLPADAEVGADYG